LILCKEHLINAGFVEGEEADVDYQNLNEAREVTIKEKGSKNEKRIKESEDKHKTTMDFLKSFFKKECSTNIEQPSVESAVNRQQDRFSNKAVYLKVFFLFLVNGPKFARMLGDVQLV